jgi:hypothetical protein
MPKNEEGPYQGLWGPNITDVSKPQFDSIKDISKIIQIGENDATLKDVVDKLQIVFDNTGKFISYIESLEQHLRFGANINFEQSKIADFQKSVNELSKSIKEFNETKSSSKSEDISNINTSIEGISGVFASIKDSNKVQYYDEEEVINTHPDEVMDFTIHTKFETMIADLNTKLNEPSASTKEADVTAPDTTPAAPSAAAPAETTQGAVAPAETTQGAVAFTIQGEIDKATKQITKITSIKINECEAITDIRTDSGKIQEDKGLTEQITNCITGTAAPVARPEGQAEQDEEHEDDFLGVEEDLGGGRKRRTTAKKQSRKRPKRKSYRKFQSRRRRKTRVFHSRPRKTARK